MLITAQALSAGVRGYQNYGNLGIKPYISRPRIKLDKFSGVNISDITNLPFPLVSRLPEVSPIFYLCPEKNCF